MKKAIVIGGSKGIGKAISDALQTIDCNVVATSRKDVDTSDLASVKRFTASQVSTDILVLNSGRPPIKDFFETTEQDWITYHNQLFLGFCMVLQNLKVNKNGYIFLISSNGIKEPRPQLVLSNAYRSAFSNIFKTLSQHFAIKNVTCINIAPGPIHTDSITDVFEDLDKLKKRLPMKRLGKPEEVGNFVKSIVENEIKYLSGAVITFDGANSSYVF